MVRFHIPAVPHTRPTSVFSHCAFTTKARLLPQVLRLAYPHAEIVWYGVADDRPDGCDRAVGVMTDAEWQAAFAPSDPTRFVGEQAHVAHPGYVTFNAGLSVAWSRSVEAGDVVCFPFGHAHQAAAAVALERGGVCVETGIGYPTPFLPLRIYESRAWMHYLAGLHAEDGSDYHLVVPHYYDLSEWPSSVDVRQADRDAVVYVGRLIASKGLDVLAAIADAMPSQRFVLYGQGDPTPWLRPNVQYGGVLDRAGVRDVFLHAKAALFPTRYIEPFCQAHIEALLCGCPVVASDFGVFPETQALIRDVRTARSLPAFVAALEAAAESNPVAIQRQARELYGLGAAAGRYHDAMEHFRSLTSPAGWYGEYFPTRRVAIAAQELTCHA